MNKFTFILSYDELYKFIVENIFIWIKLLLQIVLFAECQK
jgi:hypothetical protein